FPNVPVISLNMSALDTAPGFKLTLPLLAKFAHAIVAGDFLMLLANQCRPYEDVPGTTDALVAHWQEQILTVWSGKRVPRYAAIKKMYPQIVADFRALAKHGSPRARVGIVGEIYMKYSPMGNNHLADFLEAEGAEVVIPGLLDFCMYCVCNSFEDRKLYGGGILKYLGSRVIYKYFLNKQRDIINTLKRDGTFSAPMPFSRTYALAEEYIGRGVKMGEGWLLTVEMAELLEEGVPNIVCTQPFGCLPNHIVGKGMINEIKSKHPEANIVPIDYDPGASEINQQNRIKMMLASATRGGVAHADV
ncbi:MAG: 2-hydroxyglutaryl-CoA dehydratase, partial [Clostridia bacterium]